MTWTADDDDAKCSNGFVGVQSENICCHVDCGTCGGSECRRRGKGLGAADCCRNYISKNGALCSENLSAPCIMDDVTGNTPDAEGEGCFTITDLYNFRLESDGSAKGPIFNLDDSYNTVLNPKVLSNKWLLTAELHITGGAVFYCRGSSIGGDCDELRIQSTGPTDFHEVRAHGGSMYFESTIVTSWDTPNKTPQATYVGGRSFLNCVSEKLTGEVCVGQAQNEMGECRMDIINSEIGYLGYFDSESYGLTWKVRGFCKDLSNPDVFDTTNVYGNLIGSDIHHNYYGQYSYGHQGGVWHNNQMHDNHQYGFDPHDDSDYLTSIIASKRCNNVQIYNNEVYDGGPFAAGIFLHRSSDYAIVHDNVVHDMQDAGMAMLESMNADIYNNRFSSVKFGIRLSLGSSENHVHENLFEDVSTQGLYTYQGSDEPTDGVSDGRPSDNLFENNRILNVTKGVKIKEGDDTVITDNVFTGTSELEFFDAQNTRWKGNTLPQGVCIKNIHSDDGIDIELSTFDRRTAGLPTLEC
ncbi:Mannuronan C-5-epimerase N-terminal fragment [Ectocarpus siliculosus]|uniref:Mannuronan C-5-epimerase N-terminal n=1 Tax=Ectocarpus siliculosus TaxID=2880 RepID=D8LRM4_ECTSI|nr:Mannuronan C-5-epimerase N-terminal fragment [Ectocarpus siliculosus]